MTDLAAPTTGLDPRLEALQDGRFGTALAVRDSLDGNVDATADELGRSGADVVLLGPGLPTEAAIAVAERLERHHPEMAVILVANTSNRMWRKALEAGVQSVVPADAELGQLVAAVERLLSRVERRRSNTVIDLRGREAAPAAASLGRVITVLSPKGGSGKTTVATNLAANLAKYRPNEVVIVDLDLQFGDVADALLLTPSHTLADLPRGEDLDSAAVKLLLASTHGGLYALCAPDDPAAGEEIPDATVATALDALAADLPFVVVDTGAGIDAAALSAVERSTDLVFVGSLDVPSVRSVKKLLVALDRLGMTEARRHVVLNRSDSNVGITAHDVEATLGLPITVSVPSSRSIPESVNAGVPVVIGDPRSTVAQRLQELTGIFTDVPDAEIRRPLFRRTR